MKMFGIVSVRKIRFVCLIVFVSATADATVKIHRITTDEFIEPSRNGKSFFSHILNVDNSANPVEEKLDIYCYKTLADKEIVEKRSGSVFLPKTPELYQHDADGNLLSDGRFNYSWDAENRLVGVESSTGVPPVSRIKVEFSYDYCRCSAISEDSK